MDKYEQFLLNLKQKFDYDLFGYKRKQMERRITFLLNSLGFNNNFDAFIEAMSKDEQLYRRFINHTTINVSEFFRNPLQWKVLQEKILPGLLSEERTINIWSVGCSTGEEPYTMGMIMEEYFPQQKYSILATDCNETILQKGKEGVFSAKSVKKTPENFIHKYFIAEGEYYCIKSELKEKIFFKSHNVLRDSFPRLFDLVICRNVVIYFIEETKNQLYHNFHEILRPGGFLFTGGTEQILQAREIGYETVEAFFYRKPLN